MTYTWKRETNLLPTTRSKNTKDWYKWRFHSKITTRLVGNVLIYIMIYTPITWLSIQKKLYIWKMFRTLTKSHTPCDTELNSCYFNTNKHHNQNKMNIIPSSHRIELIKENNIQQQSYWIKEKMWSHFFMSSCRYSFFVYEVTNFYKWQ